MENEKQYVAFHRERQKPIDAYKQDEINMMLEQTKNEFKEMVTSVKKETHNELVGLLNKLVDSWRSEIESINKKLDNCYPEDQAKTEINWVNSTVSSLQSKFSELESYAVKIGETVDKYMNKKRFWQK